MQCPWAAYAIYRKFRIDTVPELRAFLFGEVVDMAKRSEYYQICKVIMLHLRVIKNLVQEADRIHVVVRRLSACGDLDGYTYDLCLGVPGVRILQLRSDAGSYPAPSGSVLLPFFGNRRGIGTRYSRKVKMRGKLPCNGYEAPGRSTLLGVGGLSMIVILDCIPGGSRLFGGRS